MTESGESFEGLFLPRDGSGVGHLKVAGAESAVKIISANPADWSETGSEDLQGALSDGRKASLLNCVLYNERSVYPNGTLQYETRFFPNYAVIGDEYIRSDEAVVRAVCYHFEGVEGLVSGHRTFRSLRPGPEEVRRLLESEHQRNAEIAEKHGWPKSPFDPEISEHPELLYFSGVGEVVHSDTRVGRISLINRSSHGMGNARGIGIKNQVCAAIKFPEPTTVDGAVKVIHDLHGFFELSIGHRLRYHWIELELNHRVKERSGEYFKRAQLYWNMCNTRIRAPASNDFPMDVLLVADRRPEEFSKVVGAWLDSSPVMADPRERLATALFGSYGINRTVGAANMFDLLPEEHAPKKHKPDEAIEEAVNTCRKIFKLLPDSFAKQSVLSALGRVGNASLRDKVLHRANIVLGASGDDLPELYLPCGEAVLCRNHYVHGSEASFDYRENPTEYAFITNTLEFVFGVSDLIELGWDFAQWRSMAGGTHHPFGAYLVTYSENLKRLKAVLPQKSE